MPIACPLCFFCIFIGQIPLPDQTFSTLIGMQMDVELTRIWLSCRFVVQFPTHAAGIVSYIYYSDFFPPFSFLILQNTVKASKEMGFFC